METEANIIAYLRREFDTRRSRNPQYSLRAFANLLDVHSATLSLIFNGKRPVGLKLAKKILTKLRTPAAQKQKLLLALASIPEPPTRLPSFEALPEATFELVASWEHFAILALTYVKDFRPDPTWIGTRLGISREAVESAVDRLERAGLLSRSPEGWKVEKNRTTTTHDVPSESIQRANREHLEKALQALADQSVRARHMSGLTLSVNTSKLASAAELIRKFKSEMAQLLDDHDCDDVYRLNVELFSLTKTPA